MARIPFTPFFKSLLPAVVITIAGCESNNMYQNLLNNASPDYLIQMQFFDNEVPLGETSGMLSFISPTAMQMQGGDGPAANMNNMPIFTDPEGKWSYRFRSGRFEILLDVNEGTTKFTIDISPESSDFSKSPSVTVKAPAPFRASVLYAIPQTPESQFRTSVPIRPLLLTNAGGINYQENIVMRNRIGDVFFNIFAIWVNEQPPAYEAQSITVNANYDFEFSAGHLSITGPVSNFGTVPGSRFVKLGAFELFASDSAGQFARLEFPVNLQLMRAFVSSVTTPGDLSGLTNAFPTCANTNKTEVANCACQRMAAGAKLPRADKFRAGISNTNAGLNQSMRCNVAGVLGANCSGEEAMAGPWYQTFNGMEQTLIATDLPGLISSGTGFLFRNQHGNEVTASSVWAWTGTDNAGQVAENCSNWTTMQSGNTGAYGVIALDTEWLNAGSLQDCSISLPIYCFEGP